MADRYWVGGTGTWDATSTTKWSATSGGASGASVPTAADAVIFNSASSGAAYTVTLTGTTLAALSLSVSNPATGVLSILGSGSIFFGGNLTVAAGVLWGGTGNHQCNGTSTWVTNGVSFGCALTCTTGGNVTLGGALTLTDLLGVAAGTFTTAGFAINALGLTGIASGTRTINLGASVLTLTSSQTPISLGAGTTTLSAGTVTVNITATDATLLLGNNQTWNTINLTNSTTGGTFNIGTGYTSSACTITNFNITPILNDAQSKVIAITAPTFTFTNWTYNPATVGPYRIIVVGRGTSNVNAFGTSSTLTVTTATLNSVDFAYITKSGAALTGTSFGNITNNSNITFPAAKNVWWNGASGSAYRSANWALSAGGATSIANLPLPQDTWFLVDTGLAVSGSINCGITPAVAFPTIDASARTLACSLTKTGDWWLGRATIWRSTVTNANSGNWFSIGNTTFNSGGASNSGGLVVAGGTFTVTTNNASFDNALLMRNAGVLALNDLFLTCTSVSATAPQIEGIINFGATGELRSNNNNFSFVGTVTTLTATGTGRKIVRTFATGAGTRTFDFGGSAYSEATSFSVYAEWSAACTSSAVLSIWTQTQNYYYDVICTVAAGGSGSLATTAAYFLQLYGNILIPSTVTTGAASMGISCRGTTSTTFSIASSRNFSFSAASKTFPATVTFLQAFTSSGSGSIPLDRVNQNGFTITGIAFVLGNNSYAPNGGVCVATGNAQTVVNYNGTGTTITGSSRATFNLTYSGSVGVRQLLGNSALNEALAKTDINITAGSDTVNVSGSIGGGGMGGLNFTGFSGSIQATYALTILGSLTLHATGGTLTGWATQLIFGQTANPAVAFPANINLNGRTLSNSTISFNHTGQTFNITGNGTMPVVSLLAGTLALGTSTLTVSGAFTSSGTTARVLALQNGTLALNGGFTGNNTGQSCTGTSTGTIQMGNATTFAGGGASYFGVSFAGNCIITGANTFTNFGNTLASRTITLPASTTTTVTNFNLNGTAGNLTSLISSSAGTQATLSKGSGTVAANYLSIQDSNATGGATWNATNSTNVSNNTGWNFLAVVTILASAFFNFF